MHGAISFCQGLTFIKWENHREDVYSSACVNTCIDAVKNAHNAMANANAWMWCFVFRCRRWLLRRRGRWRGRRILVESRIARPDLARKFQRRKGFNSCQLQHHAKRTSRDRRKDQRRGQARPMLNVEVLPPSQNHENVILPVCILLVMNPAIFPFCWQDLWEPFLCACVLERVMFVLGLLCLGWTLMAAKVFDFGMNCGALLSRFSLRRMSRRTSGRNGTASIAPASTEMAPQVLRQRQDFTNLEQARANETKRWRMLQEPWFLRRCQRAERRAATRRQSLNTFLRRSLI